MLTLAHVFVVVAAILCTIAGFSPARYDTLTAAYPKRFLYFNVGWLGLAFYFWALVIQTHF